MENQDTDNSSKVARVRVVKRLEKDLSSSENELRRAQLKRVQAMGQLVNALRAELGLAPLVERESSA